MGIGIAVLSAVVGGMVAFGWRVDEGAMRAKGWGSDPDVALAAAKTSGRPVFLKLGSLG
jgi:hypothetical protein